MLCFYKRNFNLKKKQKLFLYDEKKTKSNKNYKKNSLPVHHL